MLGEQTDCLGARRKERGHRRRDVGAQNGYTLEQIVGNLSSRDNLSDDSRADV